MFDMLKTLTLSAMIGLGAVAAMPASAQAEGVYLNFGGRHDGARVGVYVGDGQRADYRRHDYRRYDDRRHHKVRACTPERAVNKAERMGVRRARVVDVDRRSIDVVGRKHGDRVRLTFSRAPNCPIVRW